MTTSYAYYPGCSLTASAVEYDASTRAVLEALGAELHEIPEWTCCGASAAGAVSRLLSLALPARSLALAERELPGMDVLAPCSACYLNLLRARNETRADKATRDRVGRALDAEGLTYAGAAPVRDLLDVLVNDLGAERLAKFRVRWLSGLTIAPYYGCQALRPYRVFDDPERPTSMDALIRAVGAEVLDWDMGARCCGASLMVTHKDQALADTGAILAAAQGADAIVTVCPMCQMNLEAWQGRALDAAGGGEPVAVLYLPQLLGLALGLGRAELGLGRNMVLTARLKKGLSKDERPEEEPIPEEGRETGAHTQPPQQGG